MPVLPDLDWKISFGWRHGRVRPDEELADSVNGAVYPLPLLSLSQVYEDERGSTLEEPRVQAVLPVAEARRAYPQASASLASRHEAITLLGSRIRIYKNRKK
jgi:hypothetical protein